MRDALAQNLYFYQDNNNNKKLDLDLDNIMSSTDFGKTFSFSASLKF
jgi:hypothetical protein